MQVSRIVGLAAGVALFLGVSANASAQTAGARADRRAVQTDSTRAAKGAKQGGTARGGQRGGGFAARALLRGITLTEAQQTQVNALQAKYAEQAKAQRAPGNTGAGERRARPDSATMVRLRAERQAQAAGLAAELRSILTAEQRVVFEQNLTAVQERAKNGPAERGPRGARGGRNGR